MSNTQTATGKIEYFSTQDLNFDPENPRFYRLNDPSSVPAVIEEMLDDEGVQDLMLSIGEKDYFEGEPLLVAEDINGALIVVEGNRRLAATKLLNGDIDPSTSSEARRRTSLMPCHASATQTERTSSAILAIVILPASSSGIRSQKPNTWPSCATIFTPLIHTHGSLKH
jgi:hypothetical protein